ncbi:nitrate/nitrite transporter NrtS [Planktomarina sp.]|nr:nitrate/nitrite transporter NrtS [Planktomarina sp.]MDA9099728.1 nitrate/nitrite transporter NrtS [Planktomarina sp.]
MARAPSTRFMDLAFSDGTPKKAFFTALVVGTVLTVINHGDVILSGNYPPAIKVLLTYCVPFCVTTWGSILGKKASILNQKNNAKVA